jgi:hypothetical protein
MGFILFGRLYDASEMAGSRVVGRQETKHHPGERNDQDEEPKYAGGAHRDLRAG